MGGLVALPAATSLPPGACCSRQLPGPPQEPLLLSTDSSKSVPCPREHVNK